MVIAAGNAGGQVREDEVVPAEMCDQPIDGCQRNALLPFFGRDLMTNADCRLLLHDCLLLPTMTLAVTCRISWTKHVPRLPEFCVHRIRLRHEPAAPRRARTRRSRLPSRRP